jgi:hypothetical protein
MVNVPFPVQPLLPVKVHVPEIVLPLAVPESASVLPVGDPDSTVKPNFPFTFPLKSPLSVKEPPSVSPETKQGELVVKLKLETVSDPSPFPFSEVPNVNTVALPPLTSVAFHVPLMFDAFELFEPQPISARLINKTMPAANRLMKIPLALEFEGARKARCENQRRGGFEPQCTSLTVETLRGGFCCAHWQVIEDADCGGKPRLTRHGVVSSN